MFPIYNVMKNKFRNELARSPFHFPGGGGALNLLGIDWEPIADLAGDGAVKDITYSADLDLWVGVAASGTGTWLNSRAITSPSADANSWTLRALPSGVWSGVTWSSALQLFAAVKQDGGGSQVSTSPDGIVWTARTTPAQTVSLRRIVYGADKFVVIGQAASDASLNLGFYSLDGITWNNIAAGNNSQWADIAYSPELDTYVAVALAGAGGQQRIMQSSAGISWVLRSAPTNARTWTCIDWSPLLGLFVALSSDGYSISSADGITWTEVAKPLTLTYNWQSLAWSPMYSRFAAVGSSGTGKRVAFSTDGVTWTFDDGINSSQAWTDVFWSQEQGFWLACSPLLSGFRFMRSCARFSV